jgi:isopentenyl-diphosphate delta-isomerase
MGFVTPLSKAFDFKYRAELNNGLIEHEFDHVVVGEYEGTLVLNPEEVMAAEYVSLSEIENRLAVAGDQFTVWFKIAFPRIKPYWEAKYRNL